MGLKIQRYNIGCDTGNKLLHQSHFTPWGWKHKIQYRSCRWQ